MKILIEQNIRTDNKSSTVSFFVAVVLFGLKFKRSLSVRTK